MSSHGAALAAPPRGSMKDGFSFGMAILGLALLVAIIGPSLVPHDPLTQELAARNAPPDAAHWFGYRWKSQERLSTRLPTELK